MINIIENPQRSIWNALLQRPVSQLEEIEKIVAPILAKVKTSGDHAVRAITFQIDKVELPTFLVTIEEIEAAKSAISSELKNAISIAKENITTFHSKQLTNIEKIETMPGVVCWRKSLPIEKVGLYIPGGTAPLFSTILMLSIPAKIAGCSELVLCTPPDKNGNVHPAILYTANLCGITKIFKIGGAQAIAAMAYGTESVPKVYKVFGPGNQFVTVAKQLINKDGIAIDMPAGPSEVAIIADESANPEFVAADLLSQAEHGADSQVLLVSTTNDILEKTKKALEVQLSQLPRMELAAKALKNSKFIKMPDDSSVIELINQYAAEHLIIATKEPEKMAEKITSAGSIFLGHYTPEAAGDYASGTNHTLPTNGHAVAYSGVSVDSFCKKVTFQSISKEGIKHIGPTIEIMAAAEMLEAHKNAVTLRLNSLK